MATQQQDDGWKEWSQYVRLGLNDLKEKIEKLQEKYEKINLEVSIIKIKVAIWGGVGATVATGLWHILTALFKMKGGP